MKKATIKNRGMSLIETLVAIAFLVAVSVALYQVYAKVLTTTSILSSRAIAASLANEQFEIIRNMPYASVGTLGGIPAGPLLDSQTIVRDNTSFTVDITIRNIDDPFDGTIGGIPNDLSPADNKLVVVEVSCATCKNFVPVEYTSRVAPKNLETASTNGALVIRVYDANGLPVSGADVDIDNTALFPEIHINDVTGIDGTLTIVDAPPSVDSYKITISKSGYSTEETYPIGAVSNPNPSKPNQTVLVQQITQVSFFIDKVSVVNANTILDTCAPAQSVSFQMTGSKVIGTSPTVLKYDSPHTTNSFGDKSITGLEWDTYNINLTDETYDLVGTNPLLTLGLTPDTTQDLDLIVAPKNPNRLLIVVRDQSTGLPVTDALVRAEGPSGYDNTKTTGQGFINQTDWSGGSAQDLVGSMSEYYNSDGNIDTNSIAGQLKLQSAFGTYLSSGWLTSSTFDTGGPSNFHQISWSPTDQAVETGVDSVKFQAASNDDGVTWDFSGPDGTGSTYYTLSDLNLNSGLNNKRYFRYRVYLNTDDTAFTPTVSDASFTFTTSCTPPGQVSFPGLSSGDYTITVTKSGYQDYTGVVTVSSSWQKYEITIAP